VSAGPAPWWDLDRSLRSRIVAAAALAVAVAVTGVVVVGYAAVRRELRGPIDASLRRQTQVLQRQAALTGAGRRLRFVTGVGEIGGYAQIVQADGRVTLVEGQVVTLPVSNGDLAVARGERDDVLRDTRVAGGRVRMLTSPLLDGIAVQVALPRATLDAQLRRLAVAFGLLAAVGLAVAAGLAWAVSRTAVAPVAALTDAAERIAATRDLTLRIDASRHDELGRLAASFNTMLGALEQSVGAQRQLVADASHELRTPLASLRTNVELLHRVEELPAGARTEMLDAIVGQVEELTALVSDVVELARGDEPALEMRDLAFDEVVERGVERARRHWPAVEFTADVAAVMVSGAPGRLDRAVTNLLDNAAKFSGPGTRVDVVLEPNGRLTVRDHGPGVPEEALPHVFSRFFRADEARALPGSGLGLAIVQQLAAAHGGTVALRNVRDGGAEAELWLPPVRAS
jgi:two-component system sensor histidine kinase MprB